ncbi:MAG: hypothetical protein KAR12_15465 [Methylococcales bacterium]|nr:hypothetical protein [Methylococcales bacterium]
MIDFILNIFSTILQMDMRDHHEIPFALPLVMAGTVGGLIGFTILRFIGNEQKEDRQESRKEN